MTNTITLKRTSWKIAAALCAVAWSTQSLPQARADVLEQKWRVGQQLSYDFQVDGTLHMTAPSGVPMIGGLPLEMLVKGDGQSTLETREVDEFGSALVVPHLERMQLKLNETTFNQNGALGFRDGVANVSVNGQAMGQPNMDWSKVANPDYALKITKSLRVTGTQPLKKEDAQTPAAPKPAGKNGLPIDAPAMMQAMISRAIPPLLPTQDVKIGDTWNANIEWPVAPGQPASNNKEPAGKFTFKALAQEEVAGRKAWRIAVDGVLKVDDISTKAAGDAAKPAGPIKAPALMSLSQKTKGDIWFDSEAGHVVKADLRLEMTTEGREAVGKAADGVSNFNGKLMMQLRKTSVAGGG